MPTMMHMLHFIVHVPASTKQLQHRCITYNYNTRSTSKCAAHGYSAQVHWGAVAVVQAYGATSRNTSQLLAAAPAPSSLYSGQEQPQPPYMHCMSVTANPAYYAVRSAIPFASW
jgi:hypothetical protein